METTVIRRATRDDFDAIARLNREVQEKHARAYPGLFKPASDDTLTRKAFEALLDDRNSTTLVAVDGAEPVGYISAEAFERTETPHRFAHRVLYIHQMCVSRSAKRRGHVRQLDAVSRQLLGRAWAAGAGPGAAPLTIDLDSTICETYGLAKEGALHHGYTRVRGYRPLLAVAAGTGDVLMARLREGRANTVRGAAHFLTETIGRVRSAGASGPLTVRADSGFYASEVVGVCRKMNVRFSITIRQHRSVRRLIEAIPEEAWTPIPYWIAGGADVAETTYTPFKDQTNAKPVRLIVRRVKPTPGSQLALLTLYDFHAFITDRDGTTLVLEADHRRHAEIENAIRDLKYGVGLNHLPSGKFAANAAWLAVQVLAHNLARWTARIGLGAGIVTTKTLRRRLFAIAERLTRSARRLTLHLPAGWPWADHFLSALARLRALPLLA